MNAQPAAAGGLILNVLVRLLAAAVLLSALFFLPAGTLDYWQAWVYLAVLLTPMLVLAIYLRVAAPDLLERRLRLREREAPQKRIIALSSVYFLATYLLPGLDRRYGWSSVPAALIIAADVAVLAGYSLFALVLRENRFASRVIEVAPDQAVISTGPYAWVRHPMYLAVTIMYVFSPLALGSCWAMLPALALPAFLIARLLNEEQVLRRDLPGYREYLGRVRYRLIPGVW